MRAVMSAALLFVVLGVPEVSSAQVYRNETPPPLVNAAGATWQLNGEPIFHEGNFYYPAGATVFFDGKVMVRTGVYAGVPVYADVTLEPYSMVYVPIGGLVMRPYERRREGELAGTVGSRTPSFPIQRDVELSASSGTVGLITPAVTGLEQEYRADTDFVTVRVPVSALGRSRRHLRHLRLRRRPLSSRPPVSSRSLPRRQPVVRWTRQDSGSSSTEPAGTAPDGPWTMIPAGSSRRATIAAFPSTGSVATPPIVSS